MINIDQIIEDVLKYKPWPGKSTKPEAGPEEIRHLMREAIKEYQRRVDLRASLTHMSDSEIDKYEQKSK